MLVAVAMLASCMVFPAVAEKTDAIEWDYEADIVVVGAGGAGLPAALKALEDGSSVIMVEANYDCGGHVATSEGQLHSGGYTSDQEKWNIPDSADLYYYDHTRGELDSRFNDRDVTRAVSDSMVETYEFIIKNGIVVQEIEPMVRAYYRDGGFDADGHARMTYVDASQYENDVTGRENNGPGITRPLEKSLRDQGVPFLMNYHMDVIHREEPMSGKVLGIQASYTPTIMPGETEPLVSTFMTEGNIETTKEIINVKANKAVIIATGGSIGNENFRTMIDPRLGPEFDGLAGMPFSDQDASGELAAMKIGAALGSMGGYMVDMGAAVTPAVRMGCQYGYGGGFYEGSQVWPLVRARGIFPDYSSTIVVNMLGQRPGNEDYLKGGRAMPTSYEYFENAFSSVFIDADGDGNAECYGGPLWGIFDQAAVERNGWDMDTAVDYEFGYAFKADTLEELAETVVNKYYENIKMDPAILVETVKNYNKAVDTGVDEAWGRTLLENKIETGPFYCVWAMPNLHDTLGGLRTDGSMQVIDLDGNLIPNLFCAGESAGGMHVHGLGRVITSGYIAGRAAASVNEEGIATADLALDPEYAGVETNNLTKTDSISYFNQRGAASKTMTHSEKVAELASLAENKTETVVESKKDVKEEKPSNVFSGRTEIAFKGPLTVEITVEDGKMTVVEVTEHEETVGIGDKAIEVLEVQAVEKQSADLDAVTGATMTSEGFIDALTKAMEKAGL